MRAILPVFLVLACSSPEQPARAASSPARPLHVQGEVSPDDRRELAGAIVVGDGIVVRTVKGDLARYDGKLQLVVGAVAPSPVRALAASGNTIFAALEDKQIVRVDHQTLRFERVAEASSRPSWIGIAGEDVVVFGEREHDGQWRVDVLRDGRSSSFEVRRGRSAASQVGHPSAFLLDGTTLWFGIDAGEWGGMIGRIDLATRKTTVLDGEIADREPVYGFVKHDGRILRHGGTAHMGVADGVIGEVTPKKVIDLWKRESSFDKQPRDPPGAPVAHALVHGGRFYVLVWNELYDVSVDLKSWKKLVELPAVPRAGRPDAVGSFPATVAMLAFGEAIVFATTRDGLFVLRNGKLEKIEP